MRDRTTSVKGGDRTNVLFDVWLVSRAVTGLLDTALAEVGLTADEFGVYSVLTSSDSMTPTDLARWMAAPPTTVSSYVKRLEARGHVERLRNPDDGRSYVLRLTAAGRAAHLRGTTAFVPVLDAVVAALGAREPAVRRELARLRGVVDAVRAPSAG